MTSTIITSDRYIAIRSSDGSLSLNGIVRILTKNGLIHPARWNAVNCRLESCAINRPVEALPMYSKSAKIESKLVAAGINFAWLTADEAQQIAS
ncbi:MAG: hypothetical protein FJ184_02035 [Gammaproteobacteria bacterium]|nr:hypothetical protein [Gammaproteobacteria bacterium]